MQRPASKGSRGKTHYEILGLKPAATDADIRREYKVLVLQYHPDKNQDEEAVARFRAVQEAYETLHDPTKRNAYDKKLGVRANKENRSNGPRRGSMGRSSQEQPKYDTRHPNSARSSFYHAARSDSSFFRAAQSIFSDQTRWWDSPRHGSTERPSQEQSKHDDRQNNSFRSSLLHAAHFIFSNQTHSDGPCSGSTERPFQEQSKSNSRYYSSYSSSLHRINYAPSRYSTREQAPRENSVYESVKRGDLPSVLEITQDWTDEERKLLFIKVAWDRVEHLRTQGLSRFDAKDSSRPRASSYQQQHHRRAANKRFSDMADFEVDFFDVIEGRCSESEIEQMKRDWSPRRRDFFESMLDLAELVHERHLAPQRPSDWRDGLGNEPGNDEWEDCKSEDERKDDESQFHGFHGSREESEWENVYQGNVHEKVYERRANERKAHESGENCESGEVYEPDLSFEPQVYESGKV